MSEALAPARTPTSSAKRRIPCSCRMRHSNGFERPLSKTRRVASTIPAICKARGADRNSKTVSNQNTLNPLQTGSENHFKSSVEPIKGDMSCSNTCTAPQRTSATGVLRGPSMLDSRMIKQQNQRQLKQTVELYRELSALVKE